MNEWFNKNYDKLKLICKKITKQDDVDELFHFCLEQVLINKKFASIEKEQERFYFFSSVVKNNFYGHLSPYNQTYRKRVWEELTELKGDVIDESYEKNDFDMDWVTKELTLMKKGKDWYFGKLFDLYIEEGCSITNLSKRTTIPINSVSRDIRKVKQYFMEQKKRNNKNGL